MERNYPAADEQVFLTARIFGAIKSIGVANSFADPNDPDELVRVTFETLQGSPTTGSLELIIK